MLWINGSRTTDWFDALDDENRPLLTERDVLRTLQAIVQDADKTPVTEVCFALWLERPVCCSSLLHYRSLGKQLAFFLPKTEKLGLLSV